MAMAKSSIEFKKIIGISKNSKVPPRLNDSEENWKIENEEAKTWEEIKYNTKAITEKILGNNNLIPKKPWTNQNILELIKIRNSLREADCDEYKQTKNKITTERRIAKDKWLEVNCKEIETDLIRNNILR